MKTVLRIACRLNATLDSPEPLQLRHNISQATRLMLQSHIYICASYLRPMHYTPQRQILETILDSCVPTQSANTALFFQNNAH